MTRDNETIPALRDSDEKPSTASPPDFGKLVLPGQFARARYFPGTLDKKP